MGKSTSLTSYAQNGASPIDWSYEETAQKRSEWAGNFLRSTLSHWLSASPTASGLFNPFLDRTWTASPVSRRTLVSQARLIYNFSRGYDITRETKYADAVALGIQALDRYFHRQNGGYRWSVQSDGSPLENATDAYGHAFVILALSSAARIFADRALANRAVECWQFIRENHTDIHGGMIWRKDAATGSEHSDRSQNPLMHSFEALMALEAVDTTGTARPEAERLLTFMRTLSDFSAGRLIESFHADWSPLPWQDGGVLNLGHALEWAFLLSEWHRITGDHNALALGERFLDAGVTLSVDDRGGIRESCDAFGGRAVNTNGLWQQCEAIRTLHRYVRHHGHDELRDTLDRLVTFYKCNFVDLEYGGAFAGPAGQSGPVNMHKGDDWKLDYHTVNMCIELI